MANLRMAASAGAMSTALFAINGAAAEEMIDSADAVDHRDEIIVTGEKIARSLQDTTSSVAVFDEITIDENNFITIYDVINQTANVTGLFNDAGLQSGG